MAFLISNTDDNYDNSTISQRNPSKINFNTSNPGKKREYAEIFRHFGLEVNFYSRDLDEIVSSPENVVTHKASQLELLTFVDDTCLEIEGETDSGINIKWMLGNLDKFVGKKATHNVFLAQKVKNTRKSADNPDDFQIIIYKGSVSGKIVKPRGENGVGFGFDNVFKPDNYKLTLGESKPYYLNARYLAVINYINNRFLKTAKPILEWNGEWQK